MQRSALTFCTLKRLSATTGIKMSRVILVSNRVLDPRKAAQAGGVAVALANILKSRPSLWFGWNGNIAPAIRDIAQVRGRIAAVPLTQTEHDHYYLGYANSVLWPVLHNRLDLAEFEAGYFDEYVSVNRRLARTLQPLLRADDMIWVHDYHLIPFAAELRKLGVTNPIGFYLHVPFPPWQTFLALPEHHVLARSLAAFDLVGLQTEADVANLIHYLVKGEFASMMPDGRMRVLDSVLRIASFPIGIDFEDFANPPRAVDLAQGRGMVRIIGVDRLDYTKGLPNKFRAFGQFLDQNPDYRGTVVLTQIAPPTRESVDAYLGIRQQLESLAGSINGQFGEIGWVPIHYIHRSTPRKRLAAIYRSSRVAMVTPLRDGMNLVAKEYVAAQDPADPGVLLLSEFAGAAEVMQQALIVNPYDIGATAAAIRQAIQMGLAERKERHAALLQSVKQNNVYDWSDSFLAALERTDPTHSPVVPLQPPDMSTVLKKLRRPAKAYQPLGNDNKNAAPITAN